MRWRVGNESSITIYKDRWISRPSTFKIISSPKLGRNAKVECLISLSGGWDMQKINCNFDKEDVQEILSIPLGSGKTEDTMMWHCDKRGLYTVKSGYCIGQELAGSPGVSNNLAAKKWWLGLWKLNIPLKVKIFIWKASHEWIPTRANLTKMGLQLDNKCPMCMTETETTIHALWSCRKLQYARKEWVPSGRVLINNYGKFFDFIYDCFRLLCAMDYDVLCVTIWKVWCARNSFLHDRKRHDVWNSMNWSRVFLGAFQQRGYVVPDKGVKNNVNEIQWQPPDQGWYKINCTAVMEERGGGFGLGIVIREVSGMVMASCSLQIAAGVDFWAANALAILKSSQFGKDCGLAPFTIESDSKRVVNWIKTASHLNSKYGAILGEIDKVSTH
ncbi:hypothetical protein Dsin_009283 [Dipteronia sinensis]|uniref:Reverse transcriptase zinc-binding domain-containing protein n=1 Tax=Dipteronia sinensis TaxID=43782 RepID=A0AAE0AQP3_9ROSI|nr:hypothetical protein Dsin_009283 [Dipteronia sinensis]